MKRNADEESSYSASMSPSLPTQHYSSTEFLFNVDPLVIAQHLTMIEYSIWKKLRVFLLLSPPPYPSSCSFISLLSWWISIGPTIKRNTFLLMSLNWRIVLTQYPSSFPFLSKSTICWAHSHLQVSHWVCSVILWSEKLAERVRVLTRLLEVAEVPPIHPWSWFHECRRWKTWITSTHSSKFLLVSGTPQFIASNSHLAIFLGAISRN